MGTVVVVVFVVASGVFVVVVDELLSHCSQPDELASGALAVVVVAMAELDDCSPQFPHPEC